MATTSLFGENATASSIMLRPYQVEAVTKAHGALAEHGTALGVMPTGCGKTVVFVSIAAAQTGRVMIIAHREELIFQAARKVHDMTGIAPCIEMADLRAKRGANKSQIVVSSIQTLSTGRIQDFHSRDFSLTIWDEAHHVAARSYRNAMKHFEGVNALGVTATPNRHDKAALGTAFKTVAFRYELIDAIKDAYLVPIHQHSVRVHSLDFSHIATRQGDLANDQLAAVMEAEKNLHGICTPTIEICGDRRALVFASSVNHAHMIAQIINRHRAGSARAIDGETPKDMRRSIVAGYAKGDFQYLVNVGVATEGFDEPSIQVVVVARPTKSVALYTQMIGRGTRTLPGTIDGIDDPIDRHNAIGTSNKPNVEVLDFVGNSGKHTLINSIDVLGGNNPEDVIERAKRKAEEGAVESVGAINQSQKEIAEIEAERRRAAQKYRDLKAQAEYEKHRVDPFKGRGFSPSIHDIRNRILEMAPEARENGLRAERGLCSVKQWKVLKRFGYEDVYSKKDASSIIDQIANNGWRRPE